MSELSWGGMKLNYLYHYIFEATTFDETSIGDYITLLEVII